MRIKKSYGEGTMLVSFSLFYYAAIIGAIVDFINCINIKEIDLIKTLIFSIISLISFSFPVLIYYSSATHDRENISAIFNIATYKKKFYENYSLSNGVLLGGRWENFNKNTITSFFNKTHNEAFFLSCLSLTLYIVAFFMSAYLAFSCNKEPILSYAFLIAVNLLYMLFSIPLFKRAIELHNLFSPKNISSEIASMNIYYETLYKIAKTVKTKKKLNKLIEELKHRNEIFTNFYIDKNDEIIKYVYTLVKKKRHKEL